MTTSSTLGSLRSPLLGALVLSSCVIGTAGCTLSAGPPVVTATESDDFVYVDSAPANYDAYPTEYYEGTTVHLIGGRWYRHVGNRWAVYRREPVELGRRRVILEHRAPRREPERREEHGYRR